jgi:hypothetical protein
MSYSANGVSKSRAVGFDRFQNYDFETAESMNGLERAPKI